MNTFLEYLCESKSKIRMDESSYARLIDRIKNNDYCVVSAFRNPKENTPAENLKRHKILIQTLNKLKLGPIILDGTYDEEEFGRVTEKSVMFTKPDDMTTKEFEKLAMDLIWKWEKPNPQDSALVKLDGVTYLLYKDGEKEQLGKNLDLKYGIDKFFSIYSKQKRSYRGFSISESNGI